MNTKTFFGVAAVAAVLTLAGCASTSGTKPTAAVVDHNSGCLTSTASRIPVTSADCTAIGRSYSSEDIERTGATSAAGALRLLDPGLSVHQ
jgi:hypothetical protein